MTVPVYSEETFFYEALMRFGEVAPNKGKLTGASLTQLTQLIKDGVLLNTTINPPEQLALLDGETGQKLSEVLGEVNAQTIIENQTLTAALKLEQVKTSGLVVELADAQGREEALAAQLAAANAEIVRLLALIPAPALAADDETEQPADPV